jgi:hypothetical protein
VQKIWAKVPLAERIAKLTLEAGFDPEKKSALGIVKVRSIKAAPGKKASKKTEAAGGDAKAAGGAGKAAAPAAGAAAAKKK